jgi:hypothetical protein
MCCKSRAVSIPTCRKDSRFAFRRLLASLKLTLGFGHSVRSNKDIIDITFPVKQQVMREQVKYKSP